MNTFVTSALENLPPEIHKGITKWNIYNLQYKTPDTGHCAQ